MKMFKITKRHVTKYPELEEYDIGYYGVKISDDKEVLIYESELIAMKALEYFMSFKMRR